jgi:hypothetical protein
MKYFITSVLLLFSSVVIAQGIREITVDPIELIENQPFKITIKSASDTPACGIEVNFGDGTSKKLRADV